MTGKFDNVCDKPVEKRLLPAQKTIVQEYIEVMAPIACALDVLQEHIISLGYRLPTLKSKHITENTTAIAGKHRFTYSLYLSLVPYWMGLIYDLPIYLMT